MSTSKLPSLVRMWDNDNNKCGCPKITEIDYRDGPSPRCMDEVAVASLPDEWVPKHGGTTLSTYLVQQKRLHENVLQDIANGAKSINAELEPKLRAVAEALLAHIEDNQNKIDCLIKHYDAESPLSKETRDAALKQISNLASERVEEITYFKQEASALERKREDLLKVLLRDHFQNLIKVGHKPPRELLHEFDERAYEVNQQLLSNMRAYVELEAQLRLHAEESVLRARSMINQLCLGIKIDERLHSAHPLAADTQSFRRQSSSATLNKKYATPTSSVLKYPSEVEDDNVSYILQGYNAAILKVLNRFSEELSGLETDFGPYHNYFTSAEMHLSKVNEFQQMINKTVFRLSQNFINNEVNNDTPSQAPSPDILEFSSKNADLLAMQKSVLSLGECLQDTYNILHDAGHLWDAHILRQALAQKLTIAAVEDLSTSNDAIEMSSEIAFNVALEQLRAAPDRDKLQQTYDILSTMLGVIAESYRKHSEAELGRLEEFMNLPPLLIDALLAEFNVFLEKYPHLPSSNSKPVPENGENTIRTSTPRYTSNSLQAPLPRALLNTELQEMALRNWRNGFLETFQSNVVLIPAELERQARLWAEARANPLHMRFSLKMASHSVRAERLTSAYNTRLAEIQRHNRRLESHLTAIDDLIKSLITEGSQLLSIDASCLYPLCEWVKRTQADMDATLALDPPNPGREQLKMASYALRLPRYREQFDHSVKTAFETFERQIDIRIHNIRISNVRFLSTIKLVSEGGRYAVAEATRISTALMKAADTIDACKARIGSALHQRQSVLLGKADDLLQPLLHVVGDKLKKDDKVKPKAKKK